MGSSDVLYSLPRFFRGPTARRKFVDARKDDEEHANCVLDEIGKLYLLEAQMRDGAMGWEQQRVLRKEHAEPVLENLGKWLEEKQYSYRPKSSMGQAIAYANKRWAGLRAFVLHGQRWKSTTTLWKMQYDLWLWAEKHNFLPDNI